MSVAKNLYRNWSKIKVKKCSYIYWIGEKNWNRAWKNLPKKMFTFYFGKKKKIWNRVWKNLPKKWSLFLLKKLSWDLVWKKFPRKIILGRLYLHDCYLIRVRWFDIVSNFDATTPGITVFRGPVGAEEKQLRPVDPGSQAIFSAQSQDYFL